MLRPGGKLAMPRVLGAMWPTCFKMFLKVTHHTNAQTQVSNMTTSKTSSLANPRALVPNPR